MNYVSFSGGADSTAVAILLHKQGVDFELLFADTGAELPETYWTITRVSQMLGKKLAVVSNGGFYLWLINYDYLLPSAVQRWCTRALKQKCLNSFTGKDDIVSIGIRADEQHRAKITAHYEINYPIIDAGLDKRGVIDLCKKHDLLNPIYEWRSNCSCFCCPFQRKGDWRNMWQRHPDIYKLAEQWEETSKETAVARGFKPYGWNERYSLKELRDADDAQFNMFPECEAEACLICKYS